MIDIDVSVQQKFIDYIREQKPDFNFQLKTIVDYLEESDDWFDEIFINKNILP